MRGGWGVAGGGTRLAAVFDAVVLAALVGLSVSSDEARQPTRKPLAVRQGLSKTSLRPNT